MLDNPEKTARLLAALKEVVPFEVELSERLLTNLRAQGDAVANKTRYTVSNLSYAGDEGGIVCHTVQSDEGKDSLDQLSPVSERGFFCGLAVVSAATINQRSGWALGWWACCISEGSASPVMARPIPTHLAPLPGGAFVWGDPAVKEFAFEVRLIARVRVRAPDEASARQAVPSVMGAPGSTEIVLANQGIDILLPGAMVTAVDFIPDGKAKLVRR